MTSNYDPSRDIVRPPKEIIEALSVLDTDSVTSTMDGLGVHRTFIEGPIARVPGSKICGPALTLRFVPQREDQMRGYEIPGESEEDGDVRMEEESEKRSALWEIFDYVQPGDVIAVDGRGDLATGTFGEMLMTYFKSRGGAGVVIDTGIRDSAAIFDEVKVPVWSTAVTTGGAGHMNLFPEDINLPHRLRQGARPSGRHHHGRRRRRDRRPPETRPQDHRDSRRARRARGLRPHEAPRRRRTQQILPLQRRGSPRIRGVARRPEVGLVVQHPSNEW